MGFFDYDPMLLGVFLIIAFLVIIGWCWFIWIIAGFFLEIAGLTAYGFMMQLFIWIIIMAILGWLGNHTRK